jgi:hypothetical protein
MGLLAVSNGSVILIIALAAIPVAAIFFILDRAGSPPEAGWRLDLGRWLGRGP